MLILDSSTTLEAVLSGAVATNQSGIVANFHNVIAAGDTWGSQQSVTNSTSNVTIVAAPSSGNQRLVESITLRNADTAAITVTFSYNISAARTKIAKFTLAVGETAQYEWRYGWCVLDANGGPKQAAVILPYRLTRAPIYITTGTSYLPGPKCTALLLEMIGGGGGGGGAQVTGSGGAAFAGGGAQGGYLKKWILAPQLTTITVAIAAGGSAGASGGGTGGTGGDTTFACNSVTYTAKGGLGGVGMVIATDAIGVAAGGAGVIPTNGDINCAGTPGGYGISLGGHISTGAGVSGDGGASVLFGGISTGPRNATGGGVIIANTGAGAPGRASVTATTLNNAGVAGASGQIRIWEYTN